MKARTTTQLEEHFGRFRPHIMGQDSRFTGRDGEVKKVLYADWIASGRLYHPIERKLCEELGPFVANPHSYSSYTGQNITRIYREARQVIRQHVNASEKDVLVTTGSGMTGALMRLQEMLGLKDMSKKYERPEERPVVFITHMEHHSNHVSWQETNAEVVLVPPGENNLVDPAKLEEVLLRYAGRKTKIGAFTGCSNVTGIITPYQELARIMHRHGGYCFVDFAASAPYEHIDIHPAGDEEARLDAITFSPHKFLGGPGSCGILVFDQKLHCGRPCVPGGGNVKWTNPWGDYGYTSDVEAMEDGGTPGFMQAIKAALSIRLKEEMNPAWMKIREQQLLHSAFDALDKLPEVKVVGGTDREVARIGALAFNIEGLHYNLVVRLLNDYFGIQARGGWSCASTYCHFLFDMDRQQSQELTGRISQSNMTGKPGWVRISLHPTMTGKELEHVLEAIRTIAEKGRDWAGGYYYEPSNNEYLPHRETPAAACLSGFFEFS